jgi:hypothetical protein
MANNQDANCERRMLTRAPSAGADSLVGWLVPGRGDPQPVLFSICDVSERGLRLVLSATANIMPRAHAHAIVRVQGKKFRTRLQVVYLNRETGVAGVRWKPAKGLMFAIGQHLLQSPTHPTAPSTLAASGLPCESIARAVRFGVAKTETEIQQALQLRHLAYCTAGKVTRDPGAAVMTDEFDDRSLLLTAWHRDRAVASLRMFLPTAAETTDHEQYVDFPSHFPPRHQLVEVTRVCSHPLYRRGDLLRSLLQQTTVLAASTGRQFLLGSATDALIPLYRRIGMSPTGVHFRPTVVGGDMHEILLADVRVIFGHSVNPAVWSELYAPVAREVARTANVDLGVGDTMRYSAYRCLQPLIGPIAHKVDRRNAWRGVKA